MYLAWMWMCWVLDCRACCMQECWESGPGCWGERWHQSHSDSGLLHPLRFMARGRPSVILPLRNLTAQQPAAAVSYAAYGPELSDALEMAVQIESGEAGCHCRSEPFGLKYLPLGRQPAKYDQVASSIQHSISPRASRASLRELITLPLLSLVALTSSSSRVAPRPVASSSRPTRSTPSRAIRTKKRYIQKLCPNTTNVWWGGNDGDIPCMRGCSWTLNRKTPAGDLPPMQSMSPQR